MAPRWPSSRSAPTRTSECQRGRGRARARARAGMMCDVLALCSDWYDISDVDGESRQRSLLLVLRARARPTCTMLRLQHSRHDAPWCVCAHLHAGRLCSRSGWTELRALRSRPFRGRCWSAHLCFPVRELRHCGRMLHQSTQHVEAGASPRSQVHAWAGAALQGRSGSRAQDYLANCPAHNRIWGTWCARASRAPRGCRAMCVRCGQHGLESAKLPRRRSLRWIFRNVRRGRTRRGRGRWQIRQRSGRARMRTFAPSRSLLREPI